MAYGSVDKFVAKVDHAHEYADGTVAADCNILVYRDGEYRGYVNVHTHRTKDDSVSVGVTVRMETEAKP